MRRSMALGLCAALLYSPALAQTPISYVEDGKTLFSLDVPDFWNLRTGGPREITDGDTGEARGVTRVLSLQPESDDAAWMGFVSPPGVSSFDQAQQYLANIGKFLVTDPEVTDVREMQIGGRNAEVFTGTGSREGRDISFTAAVIDLPGPRVAIGIAVHANNADTNYVPDMNAVFDSFAAN